MADSNAGQERFPGQRGCNAGATPKWGVQRPFNATFLRVQRPGNEGATGCNAGCNTPPYTAPTSTS